MTAARTKKATQKEFPFFAAKAGNFLADAPRPQGLGKLPVEVLQVSSRARKWLRAHKIKDLDQLVEAEGKKMLSQQCLDHQVRKELHRELVCYWEGGKYKYIFALNFLNRGVEAVLSQRKLRETSLDRLSISPPLKNIILKRGIQTIGQLLLQEELKWRNPRALGNILVEEILVAMSNFLAYRSRK